MLERHFPRLCWRKIRHSFLQQAFPEWLGCPQDVSMKKPQQCWKETLVSKCSLCGLEAQSLVSWSWRPQAFQNQFCAPFPAPLSATSWGCLEKESRKAKIRASPPPGTSTPLPRRPSHGLLYSSPLIASHALLSPLCQPYWPAWVSDPPRASPPYDYACV